MLGLLLVLAPISLLDSTSMIPLAVVPLSIALATRRPLLVAGGFLSGVFVVYTAGGLFFLLGVGAIFDALAPKLERWYHQPNALELVLQIVVGFVMLGFFWKLANARQNRPDQQPDEDVTPWQAFVFGAGLTLVGLPGAFPYIGAVDQILRADLGPGRALGALIFYNVVFMVPFGTLLVVRLVLRERAEPIFAWIVSFTEKWGHRLVLVILLVVGAVLVADAIGWFFGKPLLPV